MQRNVLSIVKNRVPKCGDINAILFEKKEWRT